MKVVEESHQESYHVSIEFASGPKRFLGALPRTWAWTTVGALAEVFRGASPRPKGDPRYFGGPIPWIMISDVTRQPGKYLLNTKEGVTAAGAALSRRLEPGSLILSNSGTVCVPKVLRIEGCIHDGFVAFKGLEKSVYLDFAYWWFEYVRGQIIQENRQGVTQVNLNSDIVRDIHFPLAPLNEQRRVVDEIEKQLIRLDGAVASLRRVQTNLQRYRASVLKAGCDGRLVPTEAELAAKEGRGYESANELLKRILAERRTKWEADYLRKVRASGKLPKNDEWKKKYKDHEQPDTNELPELPKGWAWVNLGQIAWSVKDGPHYSPKYTSEGIPFVTGSQVRPSGIDFDSAKRISRALHEDLKKRCNPEQGDILYTKGGTTGIARVNTYDSDFSVWVHVAVLKLADSVDRFYVQHALNSPFCYAQSQKYTHGVGNQDLGLTRMVKIAMALPPLAEQQRIAKEVARRLSHLDELDLSIAAQFRRANVLLKSILRDAFSGKLLSQDPSDEPASVLLDRIRAERTAVLATKNEKDGHQRRTGLQTAIRKSLSRNQSGPQKPTRDKKAIRNARKEQN